MNAESPNIRFSPVSTLVFDCGLNPPFSPTQSIIPGGLAERDRPDGDSFEHWGDLWISNPGTPPDWPAKTVKHRSDAGAGCYNAARVLLEEIKGDAVITSYTRWLEAVIVKGTENQEVFVTFSPQFGRIWLESKKRLSEYAAEQPANIGIRSQYSIRLHSWAQKHVSVVRSVFLWSSSEKCSD